MRVWDTTPADEFDRIVKAERRLEKKQNNKRVKELLKRETPPTDWTVVALWVAMLTLSVSTLVATVFVTSAVIEWVTK